MTSRFFREETFHPEAIDSIIAAHGAIDVTSTRSRGTTLTRASYDTALTFSLSLL
jgi:hypothetical protein